MVAARPLVALECLKQIGIGAFLECGDSSPLWLPARSLNLPRIGGRLGSLYHGEVNSSGGQLQRYRRASDERISGVTSYHGQRYSSLITHHSSLFTPGPPISEIRVAIPRANLHLYQNIEKKWSLLLDKILNLGLYCISVWTR